MSVTAEDTGVSRRGGGASFLWQRQLDSYPDTGRRMLYLAITVLVTIMLYYELYVAGSVSTLILANLHASFNFFVYLLAFGNLIGAFGALLAGLTDRLGRANLVVGGLLVTGIMTVVVLPNATNKWAYGIEGFAVGLVEGMCLVATPALIRDFSPQMGRATAMGFWTVGPVAGSLIVAVVGSATVPAVVTNDRIWTDQYVYCGIAGLVVWLIALIGLRELSPNLRDQLMVSIRDRALIEARAKGLDIEAALKHPFRQLLKVDIVVSAFAVSVMLLIYYTAVGFSLIYLTTVFGFSVKDGNGLGNWNWGFNVIAVLLVGIISDRFRVRKPFMVHRRRHRRGHGRGLPGAGRPPPGLLHGRAHAGGAVARPRHRLRPVDGELHRDGGGPQPGPHRDRPGDLGLDSADRGLRLLPDHPGRRQHGHPAGHLRDRRCRPTRPSTAPARVRDQPPGHRGRRAEGPAVGDRHRGGDSRRR